jgi:hypothetical protein
MCYLKHKASAATLPEPSTGSTDADGDWAEFEKLAGTSEFRGQYT